MWIRKRNRMLKRLVLGFAVAAVVAPGAQARIATSEGVFATTPSAVHETDGRASLIQRPIEPISVVPHETDGRASLVAPHGVPTTAVRADGDGFGWNEAGVVIAFGALLVAGAAALVLRDRGRLAGA